MFTTNYTVCVMRFFCFLYRITPRKTDEVHCDMLGCDTIPSYSSCPAMHISRPSTTSTVIPRSRRVSLTFRKVRHCACTCSKLILATTSIICVLHSLYQQVFLLSVILKRKNVGSKKSNEFSTSTSPMRMRMHQRIVSYWYQNHLKLSTCY